MFETLLAGVIAGFLWLDRYQLFQLMLSRPIVAGPITGFILGDFSAGCSVGIVYELLWLRRPPVGGYIAPDTTLASISATCIAIRLIGAFTMDVQAATTLSFFVTYPVTIISSRFDGLFRIILGKFAVLAEKAILNENDKSVLTYITSGLVLGFISAFFIVTTYVTAGFHLVSWGLDFFPSDYYQILNIGFYAVIILGISDMIGSFNNRLQRGAFAVGLVLAASLCIIFSNL